MLYIYKKPNLKNISENKHFILFVMITKSKNALGELGESIATMRLQQHGYKIIIKNWRFKHKELDIIAQKDGKIVFVEVKTRTNPYFEAPSEAVTIKKQRLLIEAANQYLIQHQIDMEARFDVVSVIIHNGKEDVEIMEDAFYPLLRGR